jgi:hypothetical protein
MFASLWESRSERVDPEHEATAPAPDEQPPSRSSVVKAAPSAAEATPPRVEPAATVGRADPRVFSVLKSGVVDGMAYTIYADGSIEAELPEGTVRFASVAELQAYRESHS